MAVPPRASSGSGIYQIVNLANGKSYVGSAVTLSTRWRQHQRRVIEKQHSKKLQNAFNKYGLKNFEFLVLEKCELSELEIREQYWIDFLNVVQNGYNTRPQANSNVGIRHASSPMLGRKHSAETLQKLRESHMGQPGFWLGRKRSPETIEKIRQTLLMRSKSLPGAFLGRRHSEESKEKMRQAKKRTNAPKT